MNREDQVENEIEKWKRELTERGLQVLDLGNDEVAVIPKGSTIRRVTMETCPFCRSLTEERFARHAKDMKAAYEHEIADLRIRVNIGRITEEMRLEGDNPVDFVNGYMAFENKEPLEWGKSSSWTTGWRVAYADFHMAQEGTNE